MMMILIMLRQVVFSFLSFLRAGCLTPGTTYYIQLDSYVAAVPSDSTRLIVTDMGSPLNASFTG